MQFLVTRLEQWKHTIGQALTLVENETFTSW